VSNRPVRTVLVQGTIDVEHMEHRVEPTARSRNLHFALLVLLYFAGLITGFGLALVQ
jgi:hypothetical protein